MGRYPITSGKCDVCAGKLYQVLTKAGYDAEIGHMATDFPAIITRGGVMLSRRLGSSPAYHEFVRVGDRVFDALTGSKGMSWDEYSRLFYDDVFTDGTININYSKP